MGLLQVNEFKTATIKTGNANSAKAASAFVKGCFCSTVSALTMVFVNQRTAPKIVRRMKKGWIVIEPWTPDLPRITIVKPSKKISMLNSCKT